MARDRKGFTLIEGIFSMFLIFLVLGALTYTLRQAGQVKSNLKNMGELSEVVQVMAMLKADLGAALKITSPTEGSGSDRVSLDRIDPRLPIQARINDFDDLDPFDSTEQVQVSYFLEAGLLKRQSGASSGVGAVERLVQVTEFEARRDSGEDLVTVTFETSNSRRSVQHSLKVALR